MKSQLVITSDHAVLKNHVVHGQPVLPGMAYLDLIYRYLETRGRAFAEWELREVSIYRAMSVQNEHGMELSFEERADPDGSIALRIEGAGTINGSPNGESQLYATARAYPVGAVRYDDTLDRKAKERSKLKITSTEVYEFHETLGLHHGDFMRVHGTVYVDGDDVYVDAEVGDDARAVASDVIFHPALMDGSVVCAAAGAVTVRPIADEDSGLRLPVYIESFRARSPLRSRCTARLRTELMHTKGDAFYSTVEFFDEGGEKVAELRDVATTAGIAGLRQAAGMGEKPAGGDQSGSQVAQDATASKVESVLLELVAKQAGQMPDDFDATMHFAASGLDSASLLAMLSDFEKRIGETVSPIALFEYPTIRDLAGYLVVTHGAALLEERLATPSDVQPEGVENDGSSVAENPALKAKSLAVES